jgi:putative transcriptional regulator
MGKMFELLKEGLEDALEYHRGNVKLRTKLIIIPDTPKKYKSEDIKNLRNKLKFSQSTLATWLNVSLNTVQAWEQGTRNPSHAVLRLLDIFDKNFSLIESIYDSKLITKKKKTTCCNSTLSSERQRGSLVAKSKQYSLKKRKHVEMDRKKRK